MKRIDFKKQNIPFTQVANGVLNDKRLSPGAKGIYAYLYSKPEGWDFASERIAKDMNCGQRAILGMLNELKKIGYLRTKRLYTGRMVYMVIFPPDLGFYGDEPDVENSDVATEPHVENSKQLKQQAAKTAMISNKELLVIKSNTNKDTVAEDSNGQINPFIELFKEINPTYQGLFRRKDQRDSCSRLLKVKSIDDWQKIIKFIVSRRLDRFCPKISTPSQLEMKYADLETYAMGLKQEAITKKSNVAF